MDKIGEYSYPTRGTFQEAIEVAQEAIIVYDGVIPVKRAAEKLGFSIKDGTKIGGPIYAKLNDLAMFGLFSVERGGYKVTDVAIKALDPNDSSKAAEGKSDALRRLPIIQKLYTELRGEIPSETALPAKISKILNVPWPDAQKQAPGVLNLIKEAFPYLKPSTTTSEVVKPPQGIVGGEVIATAQQAMGTTSATAIVSDMVRPYGEVKTTSGTIVVRSKSMLRLARELLNQLEEDFDAYEKQTAPLVKAKRHDHSKHDNEEEKE